MLKVFIGFDSRQPVAFNVAALSLLNHVSEPVAISPLVLDFLPIRRTGLTPFTFSRFLVPYLCNYEGKAIFVDADVLFRANAKELIGHAGEYACSVVHHCGERKFERASVMVFNNEKCKLLTPDYIEKAPGLLTMDWCDDLGSLPKEWNHLVGYDKPDEYAKLVHFTQGLPCYEQTFKDEHAEEWRHVAQIAVSAAPWEVLMGNSVHRPYVEARAA